MAERQLYPICRTHLEELSDETGMWQHATGARPNRAFGYCTDDLARRLEVDLLHWRGLDTDEVATSAWRSMAFLQDGFNARLGRFRNFRSAEGEWLDESGSEDSHARAVAALGATIATAPDPRLAAAAARLFESALPATRALTGWRPMAAALIGCDAAIGAGAQGDVRDAFEVLSGRLVGAFSGLPSDWPWPDPVVTYENALLPRALVVVGLRLDDDAIIRLGCGVLEWLALAQTAESARQTAESGRQTAESGWLTLVGNECWWPRGEAAAQFDQQPIDATAFLLAAEAAYVATAAERYRRMAEMAYGWFLGDNDTGVPVAIPATGGCHDGLTAGGVNRNQGAESTLMWNTALEHVRRLRAASRSSEAAIPESTSVSQVSK